MRTTMKTPMLLCLMLALACLWLAGLSDPPAATEQPLSDLMGTERDIATP